MSAPARRAAAVALFAVFLAALYAALVRPTVEAHRELDARASQARAQAARERARAGEATALQRALTAQGELEPAQERYLSGRTPALAAAHLQGLVKRAVEAGEGELVSLQVMAAAPGEVAVRARVRGDVRALQRTLHRLEAGAPVLFVDNLLVDAGPPEGGGERRRPVALQISFDAIGRTREGPAADARPASFVAAGLRAGAGGEAAGWPLPALERYAEVLARPLFEPTRRMPAAAVPGAAAPAAVETLRLAGVLADARRQVALLQDAASPVLVTVRRGESHDGWTVVEVGAGHVLLRRGAELRRLGLSQP